MIEWNNGLNLGIESIDSEHKNLLNIINRLADTLHFSNSKKLIDEIFNELIYSAKEHSKNEEALLEKSGCSNFEQHVQEHNDFINAIINLRERYLNRTPSGSDDTTDILFDLLLTHIITEDIPLIEVFKKAGLIEEEKDAEKYLFKQLIDKTTNSISYTKRIFLSTFVPLVGMLILSFSILIGNYYEHQRIKSTLSIAKIISNINSLAHSLQIERGLSSGYIHSTQNKFRSDLHKQHKAVDLEIKLFNKKLESINSENLKSIQKYIKKFKTDILTLDDSRQAIDLKKMPQEKVIDIYTQIIKNILNITTKMSSFNLTKELDASISSLSHILQFKEALGQSRAYGTIIIEEKNTQVDIYIKFIQLFNSKKTFLEMFEQSASPSQREAADIIINSSLTTNINSYIKSIKNRDFKTLDSEIWFKNMTEYINSVKIFENKLLDEINTLLKNKSDDDIKNLILWIIYILSIFSSTIFIIYIFDTSTKKEFYQLTNAMKYLADGGRDLKLTPTSLKDAFSQMYSAYEISRQKLLRGDIYTQLYKEKHAIELKKQQLQNIKLEEMAFIDPLTSCVNRRKFEELSALELQRSLRYKSKLSFLMLDIDHFKAVNDTYGHATGDEVLKHFSSTCLNLARELDIVARIGGEEFIVMMPETDEKGAYIFAERFREKIFNSSIVIEGQTIKYTVSIGISLLNLTFDKDISTVIQRADLALYEAKDSGRNKSVIKL